MDGGGSSISKKGICNMALEKDGELSPLPFFSPVVIV